MTQPSARFTHHAWARIPVDRWGMTFEHPHGLCDGRGSGYTPHQAFVTGTFVEADRYHPIETSCVRVVSVTATHVMLVVGPNAPSSALKDALTRRLKVVPKAVHAAVYTRFVPGLEIGRGAVADDTFDVKFDIGLPMSLED